MKKNKNITTFDEHLDQQYGEKGTSSRDRFEQKFEVFKFGVILEELRKKQKLTQEQLAKKCNTTKTYISRIENGSSDIRLSTLLRIVNQGLGGKLKLSIEINGKIADFDL
jgi:HTH-type transcriptional regulator/antitoxin HipB